MIICLLKDRSALKIDSSIYGSSEGKETAFRVVIEGLDEDNPRYYVAAAKKVSWFMKSFYVEMRYGNNQTIFVNKSSLKKRLCSTAEELDILKQILPAISNDQLFKQKNNQLIKEKADNIFKVYPLIVHKFTRPFLSCQRNNLPPDKVFRPRTVASLVLFARANKITNTTSKIFESIRPILVTPKHRYIIMSNPNEDRLIGAGTFKKVYFAIDADTGAKKAVAVCTTLTHEQEKASEHEIRLTRENQDIIPEMIKFEEVHRSNTEHYIIMDYCDSGTIENLKTRYSKLSPTTILKLAKSMAQSLNTMHHLNILHRDIKPANFFLHDLDTPEPKVKIADLGLSCHCDDLQNMQKRVGTPYYNPPELQPFQVQPFQSKARDVWALGMTYYELFSSGRTVPSWRTIGGDTFFAKMASLQQEDIEAEIDDNESIDDAFKPLLKGMLTINPEERLSMEQVAMMIESEEAASPSNALINS